MKVIRLASILLTAIFSTLTSFGQSTSDTLSTCKKLIEASKYEEARSLLDAYISKNSYSSEAYNLLGVTFLKENDFQMAAARFSDALRFNNKNAQAYFNRGIANSELKYDKKAIDDFSNALKYSPNDANAYYNRGSIFYEQKRFKKAKTDFINAIRYIDSSSDICKCVYALLGDSYYDLNKDKDAIEAYDKAIRTDPTDSVALYNRALAKRFIKDYNGALKDLNQVITMTVFFPEAYFQRGLIKAYNLENPEDPIADYSKAIELDKNYAAAYYYRGLARLKKMDSAGACQDFSRAKELDYKKAKKRLSKNCK